jgi:hypothetical protein
VRAQMLVDLQLWRDEGIVEAELDEGVRLYPMVARVNYHSAQHALSRTHRTHARACALTPVHRSE